MVILLMSHWEDSGRVGAVNAKRCFEKSNEIESHIGTAFAARDLISIDDALDEDGMLRYWGWQSLQIVWKSKADNAY
jgi:hypothetical protein